MPEEVSQQKESIEEPKEVADKKQDRELNELEVLVMSKKQYFRYVMGLLLFALPAVYFLAPLFPWDVSRDGATLSILILSVYTLIARLITPAKFVRPMILAEVLAAVSCITALSYFTGGAISPFNVFFVIPIAYSIFLAGRVLGLMILALCLSILAGFVFFPSGFPMMEWSKGALLVAYAVLLTYITSVLILLRGMLIRIEGARKRAQERVSYLAKITDRLKRLNRLKTEFVERTSHQLRTPLSRISWGLQELSGGEFGHLTIKQKEFIHNMKTSTDDLLRLVAQLLEVNRLEGGSAVYRKERMDVVPILEEVLGQYGPRMEAKKISLEMEKGKYPQILGDPDPIRLVFQNVIDNAVLYTKEGGRITVSFGGTGDELIIKIQDTGIGIPKDEMALMFQRFFRASNAAHYVANGTGLGLSLCKEAMEHLGGRIEVVSEEGKGTEVSLYFPLAGTASVMSEDAVSDQLDN